MCPFFTAGPASNKAYVLNRDSPHREAERQRIELAWRQYEPYCPDSHFLEDARSHYEQRTWELYLAHALLSNGHQLQKPNPEGPDICLASDPVTWVEAIAVESGTGPDGVLPSATRGRSEDLEHGLSAWFGHAPSSESVILRITSAVREKSSKYRRYLTRGIVSRHDRCIIAISLAAVADAYLTQDASQVPLTARALLGVGQEYLEVPVHRAGPERVGYFHRPEVQKRSGASVSARGFLTDDYSTISGVFLTCSNLINAPRNLGSDFEFLHNPRASNPLQPGTFKFGQEYSVVDDYLKRADHHDPVT